MCYSALLIKNTNKVARNFSAQIDHQEFVRLYALRAQNPTIKIPQGMESFLLEMGGSVERSVRESIKTFDSNENKRRELELSDLESEILELERRFSVKPTKTVEKSLAAKMRKREKLNLRASASDIYNSETYRIYPYYFAPTLVFHEDRYLLTPMRYRILPKTGVEIPSKYNVFNARRDSLFKARTWVETFGQKHIVFPFLKFFEWVEDSNGKKQELSFTPEGFDMMWSAGLYESYQSPELGAIRSFAMVTDEPPPEVAAAGHDRCPVFLDHRCIKTWLQPQGSDKKTLESLLDQKEPTYYSHQMAA